MINQISLFNCKFNDIRAAPTGDGRSLDDDVRSHGQHGAGGHYGEGGEEEKAQAVQHHRRELPVSRSG